MTRERAIEVLKAWDLNWPDVFTANEFEQAFAMAISALSEIKRNWIPVSERLPEDSQRVNITIQRNYTVYVTTATWDEMRGYFYNLGHAFDDVVAWRELPEPYKSEKIETCKGCLEPCIMYEPDMRACKKKVTERGE